MRFCSFRHFQILTAFGRLAVLAALLVTQGIFIEKTLQGAENMDKDWLIDPSGYVAQIEYNANQKEWRLSNGLLERRIVIEPAATTVSMRNLTTGEEYLRAVGPEARVTIDGVEYPIGGLAGQPIMNYFKEEWIPTLSPLPNAYRFQGATVGPIEKRFEWKKRPEWLSKDYPWPPKGKHLRMVYAPPQGEGITGSLPTVEIHYEIYDGIPLLAKWLTVSYPENAAEGTAPQFMVNTFVSEELRLAEPESLVGGGFKPDLYNLHFENNYIGGDGMRRGVSGPGFEMACDPDYKTQVSYLLQTPCLFRARPNLGPEQIVRPGVPFESFQNYTLLFDGTDRERRGLAIRRMYRTLAPWTNENPLMFHKTESDENIVRQAIEQCRETGFEMIIISFGSQLNLESRDPEYRKLYRTLSDESASYGIALGGYSLTSSRGAETEEDNVKNPSPCFGVGPCLGSAWGKEYHKTIQSFLADAHFSVLENDGPYPGDTCAAENHPYHHGLADSVWVQWKAQSDLYRWAQSQGIFINQPDSYFLNGGNKTAMGYRETNWSLPRAEQVIVERQNIYDGTWEKTPSMGWMFVPLSVYHGGGEAATIEPLRDHLDHYDARFADLLGAGVQACYRGPRLFDSEETKAVVVKWVQFFKKYRRILENDLIHLRRADGRDWDGWLHVDPTGQDRGLAFFYNPCSTEITRKITLPLYYAGLSEKAALYVGGMDLTMGEPQTIPLNLRSEAEIEIKIPAEGYAWVLIRE